MAKAKREMLALFPEITVITEKFTDAQFGSLMRAVFAYRFEGGAYAGEDAAVDVAFRAVVGQIDRYQDYCQQQSNKAKSSQVKPSEAKVSQSQPSDPPYPYPYPCPCPSPYPVEEEAAKPPARQKFSPPSVEEVRTYCLEKGYTLVPERFVDYYASIGWRVGKNPMKDWRAALRNWAKKEVPQAAPPEDGHCGYALAPMEDPWEAAMRDPEKRKAAGYD